MRHLFFPVVLVVLSSSVVRAQSSFEFENDRVTVAFSPDGCITSIKEKATQRELVERAMPFVTARLTNGCEVSANRLTSPLEGRLAFGFQQDIGEVGVSVVPFEGGWTFSLESKMDESVNELCVGNLRASCGKWQSDMSGAVSDERSAIFLRPYDCEPFIRVDGLLRVVVAREFGFSGWKIGLAAGSRDKILAAMRKMTEVAGIRHSSSGGAWASDSDSNRKSYVWANVTPESVDDWIDFAERGGFGTVHLHGWWYLLGQYKPNPKDFPNGVADIRMMADRLHAAGLEVGTHTLTGCIYPGTEGWVIPECSPDLISDRTYTLAEPLASNSVELVVNELPWEKHDLVFNSWSRGNALRVGTEIIQYSGIRREKPYAFTGLTRGAFGTRKIPYFSAGTKVDYLHQIYYAFYPAPRTKLADSLAEGIARVFNECRLDQIYFDGAEGMGSRYAIDWMRRHIYSKLVSQTGSIIEETSCGGGENWWRYSREGAWDYPNWAPKRFLDRHIATVLPKRQSSFLPVQFGWWCPCAGMPSKSWQTVDDTEYFASKCAGHDAPMSVVEMKVEHKPLSFLEERNLTALGRWERFRLARVFPDSLRMRMCKPGAEFRLVQELDGHWAVHEQEVIKRRADGSVPVNVFTLNSPERRVVDLRIEGLYGCDKGVVSQPVLTDSDVASMNFTAAKGVSQTMNVAKDGYFGQTLVLEVTNTTVSARGAWACAECAFEHPYRKIGDVLECWVEGDGSGALLNLQLRNPRTQAGARVEHYVRLDFTGWRHFEFPSRERDTEQFSEYVWPYSDADIYTLYRYPLVCQSISSVGIWLNEIPAGRSSRVSVAGLATRPMKSTTAERVAVKVGDQRVKSPFPLRSGEVAELSDGVWTLFATNGLPLCRRRTDERLTLSKGSNIIKCGARDSSNAPVRVEVTLLAVSETATRLDPDSPGVIRSRLSYEAADTVIHAPSRGFDELLSVKVRPGESARIELCIMGPIDSPVLANTETGESYAFDVRLEEGDRLFCRNGVDWKVIDGARTQKTSGSLDKAFPVFAGGNHLLKISSASEQQADARLSVLKRYLK